VSGDTPQVAHFPRPVPIDAYGQGGFRFADMSHRGSLICLPTGVWAWDVTSASDIDEQALAGVFQNASAIDTLVIGTGRDVWLPPQTLRDLLKAQRIVIDPMQTGPAITTYNIMLGEGRRVAAALIAV
jgi:uncharacterized protein